MMNNENVVNALIKAGADSISRDKEGKSALDHALENNKLTGTSALRKLEELSRRFTI